MSEEPPAPKAFASNPRRLAEEHGYGFRITDVSGERYYFKEAALALSRTLRSEGEIDLWHPAKASVSGRAIGVCDRGGRPRGAWATPGFQGAVACERHGRGAIVCRKG
jgi:3-oxoacyl-[acyl-carrier-protein] synthase-1